MKAPALRRLGLATLFVGMTVLPCAAAPVTLDAIDSGFYNASGLHLQTNENFLTGVFLGVEDRSFLLFDLSSISGTIVSAQLRLFNPEVSAFLHGYVSPDPTETLTIHDVTTPAASVRDGSAGVAGFGDLGSGTLYGSQTVSAADNGQIVEIALNAAALADLNAAAGQFVFGGALGTLGAGNRYVFGFTTAAFVADHTRQLVLDVQPVPEPSALGLLVVGAVVIAARRRQRSRR